MQISRLCVNDYYNGYMSLLSQLTETNTLVGFELFSKQFALMNSEIFVIKDVNDKIIATGSIFIERKFIRNFKSVGHIEDVVTDVEYRGVGLGSCMIDYLTNYARENDCYKVILDCDDSNISFYEKCGYIKKGNQMSLYL